MHCVRQKKTDGIALSHGEANVMKNVTVIFLPVLLFIIIATTLVLGLAHDLGVIQLCLALIAAVSVAWLLAMLFNFVIFAPLYWWLGRLQAKKNKKETAALTDQNPGT